MNTVTYGYYLQLRSTCSLADYNLYPLLLTSYLCSACCLPPSLSPLSPLSPPQAVASGG
jgi:hypothetical protein